MNCSHSSHVGFWKIPRGRMRVPYLPTFSLNTPLVRAFTKKPYRENATLRRRTAVVTRRPPHRPSRRRDTDAFFSAHNVFRRRKRTGTARRVGPRRIPRSLRYRQVVLMGKRSQFSRTLTDATSDGPETTTLPRRKRHCYTPMVSHTFVGSGAI